MSVIASDFHHPQCLRLVHVLARDLAVVNVEISRINLHVLSAGFTARVSDSVDYWAMLHCSHQPGQIRKMDRPSLVNLPDNVFWDTSTRCNSDIPQLWTGWQSPPTQRNPREARFHAIPLISRLVWMKSSSQSSNLRGLLQLKRSRNTEPVSRKSTK